MKYSTVYFVLQNQNGTYIYTHQKLLESVITSAKQSDSVILSLAQFLAQTFPNLLPPQLTITMPLSDVYLINLWMKKFVNAIEKSQALRHKDILHFKITICTQYSTKLLGLGFFAKEYKQFKWQYCHPTLQQKQQVHPSKRRKIAMCLCNDPKENTIIKDVNLAAVYMGIFYNNEEWKVYNIVKGDIPSIQTLEQTSIVIVPGSDLSVYDLNSNIQTFKNNFIKASITNHKLKYLGICFGMQLICWAFGGKVTKAKKITSTVQKIFLNKQILKKHGFYHDWKQHQQISITSYHSDEVVQAPPTFQVLAHSISCAIQIVISVDSRFFGFQGHPDYSVDYLQYYNVSKQERQKSRFSYFFKDQFNNTRKAIKTFMVSDNY